MDKAYSLWLIRLYVTIIFIVALLDILEGFALKILIGVACVAVLIQSFVIEDV